jgi:hypothetical protein
MGEVWYFARTQLKRSFTSARFYVLILLLIAVLWSFFGGVGSYLESEGVRLQVCELFILFSNSRYSQRILLLAAVLLLADAPFISEGISYGLIRSTKLKWFLGQLLYAMMMTLILLVSMHLILLIFTGGRISFANNWSFCFREICMEEDAGFSENSPLGIELALDFGVNYINSGSPYFVYTVTMLYAFLLSVSCCVIGMLLNLYFRTGVGVLTAVVFFGLYELSINLSAISAWVDPISPCYLASVVNREVTAGTMGYTVAFFVCVILAFSVFSYHKIQRSDLQKEVHR